MSTNLPRPRRDTRFVAACRKGGSPSVSHHPGSRERNPTRKEGSEE